MFLRSFYSYNQTQASGKKTMITLFDHSGNPVQIGSETRAAIYPSGIVKFSQGGGTLHTNRGNAELNCCLNTYDGFRTFVMLMS